MVDVCVVGAGIAGLKAAQDLTRNGKSVVVLEKSRGLGGRAATRSVHGNRVDHGAQHFTVREPVFRLDVERWLELGHVIEWSRGFHTLDQTGALRPPGKGHIRYACPAGMNILGKLLAEGLEVRRQAHVRQVKAVGDRWQLEFGDEEVLVAKTVLINTPATQALELCKRVELNAEIETALSAVKFQPCFAVLAGYPSDLAPEWKGVNVEGHLDLAWIAHDSSKRASPSQTVFVLHSTPAFAQKHFFDPPDQVEERLLEAASILGDFVTRPLWTDRQRWRYALADHPAQKPYYSHRNSLFFCGDWCGGARIESAYRSGVEVAEAMLRAQTAEPQL